MSLFKCVFVAFGAILLCGCLESGGEFEAINAGKISAFYENGVLKMVDSHPTPSLRGSVSEVSTTKQSKSSDLKKQGESMTEKQINADSLQVRDSQNAQSLPNRLPRLDEVKSRNGGIDSPSLAEGARGWVESTKNQPFILFFFTTTCGVCKAQIPILQEMADENIKIYGILGNAPSADLAQKFAKSSAISLPIFYESKAVRFFSQIVGGIKGVPVIVIFKDGKIKERFIGLTPKGVIKSAFALM